MIWGSFPQKYDLDILEMGGNTQELSRIYLEVVSDLKSVPKSPCWVSKLDFSTCESGNTEGPAILGTRGSGNTEGSTILMQPLNLETLKNQPF